MATVLLVRHGRTTANAAGVLAGRTAGVELDDTGLDQARRAAERIAAVPVADLVSSPQQRCRQTARLIADAQSRSLRVGTERGLAECDYGDWQGRKLVELAKEPLWRTVQQQPSAATFPGGESLVSMQHRAVAAVRRHDAAVADAHGKGAVWVAVSHGDLIKSLLADALGMHLDHFQRLNVDPASISIISYGPERPHVLATNSHAGDLGWLATERGKRQARSSTVGGGAGPARRGS
ncbi:MSMEG_4193 family putative phosphomutase [Nocardioides panacisoli]|uniref:MSMEG_4193 family putative phosphomutase n=1 Tax=Nocardioides panacisoli TaxID=627624 RepID=UPI001C624ED0|nr:MSMEG_4193 family putative phosphomutase [Nocardioides panacisoli]QYJ05035.1 MSMEG_4193 family putative phosphomutase [Nocardioides panacisoli]